MATTKEEISVDEHTEQSAEEVPPAEATEQTAEDDSGETSKDPPTLLPACHEPFCPFKAIFDSSICKFFVDA